MTTPDPVDPTRDDSPTRPIDLPPLPPVQAAADPSAPAEAGPAEAAVGRARPDPALRHVGRVREPGSSRPHWPRPGRPHGPPLAPACRPCPSASARLHGVTAPALPCLRGARRQPGPRRRHHPRRHGRRVPARPRGGHDAGRQHLAPVAHRPGPRDAGRLASPSRPVAASASPCPERCSPSSAASSGSRTRTACTRRGPTRGRWSSPTGPGLAMLLYGLVRGDHELAARRLPNLPRGHRPVPRLRVLLRGRDRDLRATASRTWTRCCPTSLIGFGVLLVVASLFGGRPGRGDTRDARPG